MNRYAYIQLAIVACTFLGVAYGCDGDDSPEKASAVTARTEASATKEPAPRGDDAKQERPGAALPPSGHGDATPASDEEESEFSHPYAKDNPNWSAWCEETVEEVERLKAELPDACEKDSDCRRITLGCPMGCSTSVARSPEADRFIEKKSKFFQECSNCVYRCKPQGQPVCSDGECAADPDKMEPEIEILR